MRRIDADGLQALTGSRKGDTIEAYAWYDGQLAYEDPLPIAEWSMSWDATRQIQTMSLEIDDKDGKLAPWLLDDPLGVGGTRLQVTYYIGGQYPVNMGWYRITHDDPAETWRTYTVTNDGQVNADSALPAGKRQVYVPGGTTLQIDAADLALVIKNARFIAPESPVGTSPTIIGEITRLLTDICPVAVLDGVTDDSVNKTLIYEDERIDAVEDLCKRIGCEYRMNGDGQFEVYPLAASDPVWKIQGGPEGALVRVDRSQDIEGLANVFVAEGQTSKQQPIRGVVTIEDGPLRTDGPHGVVPTFYSSTMLTTQKQCDAYAATMRDTQLAGLTTDLTVTCLPHPGIQQGDWVTVASPVVNGQTVDLNGRVKKMDLKSRGRTVEAMVLVVECSYSDVQATIGAVDRG